MRQELPDLAELRCGGVRTAVRAEPHPPAARVFQYALLLTVVVLPACMTAKLLIGDRVAAVMTSLVMAAS